VPQPCRKGVPLEQLVAATSVRPRVPSTTHPSRVLIVDDNSFVRQALSEIFKREADFDVCGEAANGHEAIRIAQLLSPDLIVLDLAMPVMNGLDAARMLKRLMPAVPLIMYSGIGDRFVEQQARLIGIAALISKAEAPGTLVRRARILLGQRAAVR